MLIAKYIIYRPFRGTESEDYAVLFDPKIQHADFNEDLGPSLNKPIAAGMAIIAHKVVCKGSSDSMDLAGREAVDAEVIQRTFQL